MNIFRRVAVKSLLKNRTRTIVTIIGVILSVAMFTAVTSAISTLYTHFARVESYERGSYYLEFLGTSHDALTEMQTDSDTKALASGEYLGYGRPKNQELREDRFVYVLSVSGNFSEMLPVHLTSGRMPENEHELLLPDHFPRTSQVGQTLTLSLGDRVSDGMLLFQRNPYTADEAFQTRETRDYTIVGTYERPDFEPSDGPGYTALTVGEGTDSGCYDVYVQLKSSKTETLDAYAQRYKDRTHGVDYNWSYLRAMGNMRYDNYDTAVIQFAAILFGLIMIGSISLIYSAFSISVSERTKQFGLLSSIGATKKQLRKTVIYEAYAVSLIGIPLGLLAGCGGMWVTFTLLGDRLSAMFGRAKLPVRFSVSLPALAVAALVGLLTVRISAMIPARRAMRISAIEAIRQSRDVKDAPHGGSGKLAYKLFGLPGMLSKKYFTRSRKKYRATIISLAMSVLLFVSASTYGAYLTSSVTEASGVKSYDYLYAASGISVSDAQTTVQHLSEGAGIARAWCTVTDSVYGLAAQSDFDDAYRKFMTEDAVQAGMDEESAKMQELPFSPNVCYLDDAAYAAVCAEAGVSPDAGGAVFYNHTLRISYFGNKRVTYEGPILRQGLTELFLISTERQNGYVPLMNFYQDDEGIWQGEYGLAEYDIYWDTHSIAGMPDVITRPAAPQTYAVVGEVTQSDYGDPYWPQIFLPLRALGSGTAEIQFYVAASDMKQAPETMQTVLRSIDPGVREDSIFDVHADERSARDILTVIRVFSYGFITLISLICVANVFNTISTNVVLRRRDFAMLRSVGMTQGGIYRMMVYECLLYGVRALLLGLPLSAGVAYLISQAAGNLSTGGFWMPWQAIVIAVVSVFLVVFASMLYAVSKLRRDNPVETLKEENV